MRTPEPSIRVNVDPTNPGQFFACCGLLELADRLWEEAEGWFGRGAFLISCRGDLAALVRAIGSAELTQLDLENDTSSPMEIADPFRAVRLDWWLDSLGGGNELKVWAGSMESVRIAAGMQKAMLDERFQTPDLLNVGVICYSPENPKKKVEPFYFDARRGVNAHSRDIGFSPNDLQLTTTAFPAVELLCLIGLQRCLPAKTARARVFDYYTWSEPVPPELLPAVVAHELRQLAGRGYRFENWYRTGQRKHKAFLPATPLPKETEQ